MVFVFLAPTLANAQKLTVRAVSHSTSEYGYTVTTPQTTSTNCNLYPNSANCTSTTDGGEPENKAVYRFFEVVTSNEDGKVTQYKLSRTARWIWDSMDWLNDGEYFQAEIKGKHMFITCRRGGNQGKKERIKYDILDIRPAPYQQEKWDDAAGAAREAVHLNPNNDAAHVNLGAALGKMGDWDGATTEFREALRLNPENDEAHVFLGGALASKGDWNGAIAEEREALRLNPKNDKAHGSLGVALGHKGDRRGALEEFRAAYMLDPKNVTYKEAYERLLQQANQ